MDIKSTELFGDPLSTTEDRLSFSVSAGDKTESASTRYRGGERHARLAAYQCKHHRIFDLKEVGGFRSHHELPLAG